MRLSPVYLPSANSIKCCSPPASFEKLNTKKLTVDLHRRVRNQRSFFIPIFKKGGHFYAREENIDQLRLEKERAELRLAQEQRRLTRLENRKQYYEKGERAKRTHELCNIGGIVESLAPVFKGLPKQEMYELLETVFSLPEVQHTLRSFASRKEDAGHGSVPFHSRPD